MAPKQTCATDDGAQATNWLDRVVRKSLILAANRISGLNGNGEAASFNSIHLSKRRDANLVTHDTPKQASKQAVPSRLGSLLIVELGRLPIRHLPRVAPSIPPIHPGSRRELSLRDRG